MYIYSVYSYKCMYIHMYVHTYVFNVNHIFKAIKYENCGYNNSTRLLPLESRTEQSRAQSIAAK